MNIKGLITALVTPFSEDGSINIPATEKLINRLIEDGVDGLFILGTNGEFHVMSNEEKIQFANIVVKIVDNRVPVIAGAGMNSTEATIELSQNLEKSGVDALSIITPYLLKLTTDELFFHFSKVAESTKLPVLLYNIPKNTGNSISPELVLKLASIENIVGIKDSSGNINNIKDYIDSTQGLEFSVFSGSDSLILDALKYGAMGAVAATSNVITKTDKAIFDLFYAGELEAAARMQESINEFRRILKFATVPAVLKHALALRGEPVGDAKKPVLKVTEEHCKDINQVLEFYKQQESKL